MSSAAGDVVLVCDLAVRRALVVSGKTLRNRYRSRAGRALYQDVPDERLYVVMEPPDESELARLSGMDRWSLLQVVIAPTIGEPASGLVASVCDDYVTDLMRTRTLHTRARLAQALEPVADFTMRRRPGSRIGPGLFGAADDAAAE